MAIPSYCMNPPSPATLSTANGSPHLYVAESTWFSSLVSSMRPKPSVANNRGALFPYTQIYPHDANAIVSLLDLNPSRPGEDDDHHDDNGLQHNQPTPPFEIFEAGTGMGSLTLHIARAMHAANPPIPSPLRRMLCEARFKPQDDTEETATNTKPPRRLDLSPEDQSIFDDYSASRRAILHTLDRNDKHARAAYKLVRNFRRAHYLPSVDFHVGSVDEYLSSRLEKSGGRPFLSRAILDLPSAHENAEHVVQALHSNGLLILFNPSISQIADFQSWSTETDQPLRLEKVIELHVTSATEGAVHDGGGGRNWDVKTVVPKAHQDGSGAGKPVQVMRPKVGERIAGGGFVAVLRRWPVASVSNQDSIPPEIPDETVSQ